MKDLDISLLAVLLSESCNIGFSPVSKEGFDSLKKLLDDEKTDIEFIKLLSMMMPKVKIEDEKNDK